MQNTHTIFLYFYREYYTIFAYVIILNKPEIQILSFMKDFEFKILSFTEGNIIIIDYFLI